MKFKGFLKIHSQEISNLQKLIDPLFIYLLFILIVLNNQNENIFNLNTSYFVLIISFLILPKTDLYLSCRNKSLLEITKNVISAWACLIAFILLLLFILKISIYFSRADILIWSICNLLFLLFHHVGLRHVLRIYRIKGGNQRLIVFCGNSKEFEKFNSNLLDNPWLGFKIVAWFGTPFKDHKYEKYKNIYMGNTNEIRNFLKQVKVDEIIFGSNESSRDFDEVLNLLGDMTIPISYFPCWASLNMKFHSEQIGAYYILRLWGYNINTINFLLKRVADFLTSTIFLVILSPLFVLIAVLIKIDSKGPVFFLQLRSGIDGKNFYIYKFRTMLHLNSEKQNTLNQATKFDKRVTKVGRFLRKWSLDELPQFINVIKGDMSMVGPRPHAVEHNDYYRKYIRGYNQRHFLKPGITGLAQIKGFRGETKNIKLMEQRIQNDLRYINNWSFFLDLKILLKTSYKFTSKKAY